MKSSVPDVSLMSWSVCRSILQDDLNAIDNEVRVAVTQRVIWIESSVKGICDTNILWALPDSMRHQLSVECIRAHSLSASQVDAFGALDDASMTSSLDNGLGPAKSAGPPFSSQSWHDVGEKWWVGVWHDLCQCLSPEGMRLIEPYADALRENYRLLWIGEAESRIAGPNADNITRDRLLETYGLFVYSHRAGALPPPVGPLSDSDAQHLRRAARMLAIFIHDHDGYQTALMNTDELFTGENLQQALSSMMCRYGVNRVRKSLCGKTKGRYPFLMTGSETRGKKPDWFEIAICGRRGSTSEVYSGPEILVHAATFAYEVVSEMVADFGGTRKRRKSQKHTEVYSDAGKGRPMLRHLRRALDRSLFKLNKSVSPYSEENERTIQIEPEMEFGDRPLPSASVDHRSSERKHEDDEIRRERQLARSNNDFCEPASSESTDSESTARRKTRQIDPDARVRPANSWLLSGAASQGIQERVRRLLPSLDREAPMCLRKGELTKLRRLEKVRSTVKFDCRTGKLKRDLRRTLGAKTDRAVVYGSAREMSFITIANKLNEVPEVREIVDEIRTLFGPGAVDYALQVALASYGDEQQHRYARLVRADDILLDNDPDDGSTPRACRQWQADVA